MCDKTPHTECEILVVDDNVDAADSLAALLELRGFKVRAAYGGKAALAALQTLKPKLVFLDIDMTDLDGLQTAACIRRMESARRRAALVALTARGTEQDKVLCARAGFDLHVQKPVAFDRLARFAEQACTRA